MYFNLINTKKYESKIRIGLFDDIGIKTLFDDLYDHSWLDLQDVMEFLVPEEEVLKRQAIFSDFLNDKEEKLRDFKRYCEIAKDAYKQYLTSDSDIKSYIAIVIFYYRYIEFIENGSDILNSIEFEAKEFNDMKQYFNDEKVKEEFLKLKMEVEECMKAINKMSSMIVSFKADGKYIEEYQDDSSFITLEDRLIKIANQLTIEPDVRESSYSKHMMDSYFYNRYEYVFDSEYELIRKFFVNRSDDCKYDFETLSSELNYYLKFKMLFARAQEENVNYTRVKFNHNHESSFRDLHDITIINKVEHITPNDTSWNQDEHVQIITGANGGGKTTYLRSVGSNYVIMNSLGYMFASYANISPIKYLHTHFPNDENYIVGYGRLHDELVRLDRIRQDFGEDCLALLNETYSSTDEDTALKESLKLLQEVDEKKVQLIFITHQQKLLEIIDRTKIALLNPIVDSENGNKRTFKIRRVGNEINSYANDILKKYGLSREQLKNRMENKKLKNSEMEENKNEN